MKKTLLATAAIMVAAGAYAEGVSVSGSANFGVKMDGSKKGSDALMFHNEFDIKFSASGTTDAGMTFGASTSIDNNEGLNATFEGDDVTVNSEMVSVTGTAAGTVESAKVIELLELEDPGTGAAVGGITCWISEKGAFYTEELVNAALTTPLTDPSETNMIMRTTLRGSYSSHTEVFEALGLNLPEDTTLVTGDKRKVREDDSATADDETEYAYKLKVNAGDCTDDEAMFKPGDVVTVEKALSGSETSSTGAGIESKGVSTGSVTGDIANNATVHIGMAGHKLTIGRGQDAGDVLAGGLSDVGFDGIGAEDAATSLRGGTTTGLRYDGSFGIAKIAATVGEEDDWGAGFQFSVAPVTVGIGFDSDKAASVGLGLSQGQISANVLYTSKGVDKAMGMDASFSMNEGTSVTMAYSQMGDNKGLGIGFSHALGGGATLKAGAGQVNGNTKADLGINMAF